MHIIQKAHTVDFMGDWIRIQTDGAEIRVLVMSEGVMRIRAGFDGQFAEESYTLATTAWPDRLDDLMGQERTRVSPSQMQLDDDGDSATISGGGFQIQVDKDPFRLRVYDGEGDLLHADVAGLGYLHDSNGRRIHTSQINPNDAFYGFGETTGDLDKAQQLITMSPKDALGYDARETDPLYKHIPFYIKMNRDSRKAVGYFYHNTFDCDFDLGREKSNYWPAHSRYRADGGDIDLFLLAGPGIRDIVQRYTRLTGRPPLLPKYALGYLASSMYYAELERDSDAAITRFVDIARAEGIPIDGFQLSSGYCSQDTVQGPKRCVFTWNNDRFPDPTAFFTTMRDRGVTVSPNVKPAVLDVHPRLDEFASEDVFVRRSADAAASNGDGPASGAWWGGPGRFVDFTRPSARVAWKRWLTTAVLDRGTTSVWNDNCEYDGIIDKDSECSFDGTGGTIGQLRTVMANLMCHITREAITEQAPQARPYIVCRSGHAGIQRYAQTWAGDNSTSWETLRHNVATILGMSLSGVANQGCDIGGFHGPAPEPELFVRWVQHGIFQPRFSIHSVNSDNTVTEPWMYPDHTKHIRDAIKLRYRLFPYLYSLMARAHQTGLPIMEPLVSVFQTDSATDTNSTEFMLGDSLLIANVLSAGATNRTVRLPAGDVFYDLWSRQRYEGGSLVDIPVTLDSIPVFIRGGGIVPFVGHDIASITNDEITSLHLVCATGRDSSFVLYEDDGLTRRHEEGDFQETRITMTSGPRVTITLTRTGHFESTVGKLLLDVVNSESAPYWITVDGESLHHLLYRKDFDAAGTGWHYAPDLGSVLLKLPNAGPEMSVTISFEPFDMIGM